MQHLGVLFRYILYNVILFNMKKVKYLAIFVFITLCCLSCKRESELLQIIIQNKTDSPIDITLFPKKDKGVLYPVCDGCGGHKQTEYALEPNNEARFDDGIFYSSDLNIKPYILASNAFDSILISSADNVIIFTHDNVTGYSENIFSDNSTWDFEIVEWEGYAFTKFRERYYQYIFVISNEKIEKIIINDEE